jgi:hypothetical protein
MHWEEHAGEDFGTVQMQNTIRRWGFELASKTPHLLHTILATSALHLKHLQDHPDVELDMLLSKHFELGRKSFDATISQEIAPESIDAIFATCILFAMMAYTDFESEDDIHDDPTNSASFLNSSSPAAMSWLSCQLGFLAIMTLPTVQPYLSQSIWRDLFQESASICAFLQSDLLATTIPTDWHTVCRLQPADFTTNAQAGPILNPRNPYRNALLLILANAHLDASQPENFVNFISFPGWTLSNPAFFALIKRRDHAALLLLAHWLAKMCQMDLWWVGARVRMECRAICAFLEREIGGGAGGWTGALQRLLVAPKRACGHGPGAREERQGLGRI